MPDMAPSVAKSIFVFTNPDLSDILGRTDFDVFGFQISGFPDPRISRNLTWARLGPGLDQR